jgi:hypothetical protein
VNHDVHVTAKALLQNPDTLRKTAEFIDHLPADQAAALREAGKGGAK